MCFGRSTSDAADAELRRGLWTDHNDVYDYVNYFNYFNYFYHLDFNNDIVNYDDGRRRSVYQLFNCHGYGNS